MPAHLALALVAPFAAHLAADGGPRAVRDLPGFECRVARQTADTRAGNLPAVRSAPSSTAPVVGRVGAAVFVRTGQAQGGFVGVILPDGRPGWLEETWTAPWTRGTCRVVVLDNGRIGFAAR